MPSGRFSLPVRFGNPHPTHRLRSIVAAGECFRQALQVLGLSSREIVNRDAIDSGGALVAGHLDKRPVQIRLGADLVNQAEPFFSFHSRFQGRQHAIGPDRRFRPRPTSADFSGLFSLVGRRALRHCRRVGVRRSGQTRIHLPASLGSDGITRPQRYYGRSDSCAAGSSYPYQGQ